MKLINGWTKETVLAKVKERNNGKKCADTFGVCKYRLEGNCCIAGCFIPDEVYNPSMEGCAISMDNIWEYVEKFMPFAQWDMNSFQIHAHDSPNVPTNGIYEAVEKFLNEDVEE